jgi:hypothetical protein
LRARCTCTAFVCTAHNLPRRLSHTCWQGSFADAILAI